MNKTLYKVCVSLVRPLVKLFFPYEVRGIENAKSFSGGYVLCSNHLSNMDPVFLALVNPMPICFMAKEELFRNNIFGWFLHSVGVFPVKRGKGDKDALGHALNIPKSGNVLGIFIEGTRSKTGEFLRPRSGATLIAGKTSSSILPVCITGGAKDNKIKIFKKTTIIYGKPINPENINFENRIDLKNSTNLIMDNIKILRCEIKKDYLKEGSNTLIN